MICKYKIAYSQSEEFNEELWARARQVAPTLRPLAYSEKDGVKKIDVWELHRGEYVGDIRPLMSMGIRVEPVGFGDSVDTTLVFMRLFEKIESLEARLLVQNENAANGAYAQQFNKRCSVHVPSLGLLEMREAKVEEDYCTNALNQDLKDGWKILAICPQPDQRRPDYVLGRIS